MPVSRFRALSARRQARWGLGIALVLLLGGVTTQLVRSQWQQHLRGLRSAQLDFLPEAAQRIQNFRRMKMEGDRKAWEIAAREAQYFEDEQQVKVEGPEVTLFLKGDQGPISIRGDQGKLFLNGRDMDRAELQGAIEVRFKDYLVKSDRAVYERASDTVVAPAVTITGNGLAVRGGRMTVEMEAQRLHLDGTVETVLKVGEAAGAGTL
ncbi:MAG: LPS export ABC transporter periplasmic protein LptC [Deltaproteobacteria bacterium]|nr:LPS export ABC transporter periplasmic protein LptC [Deltaproteobacteria bacterium]